MRLSTRDLLSITAIVALGIAIVLQARQNQATIKRLEKTTRAAEIHAMNARAEESQTKAECQQRLTIEYGIHKRLNQQIASLKGLVKKSLKDQRDWLEVETRNNEIIAISSSTSDPVEITDRIISKVQQQTGYDSTRFRRLMTPIEALKIEQQ